MRHFTPAQPGGDWRAFIYPNCAVILQILTPTCDMVLPQQEEAYGLFLKLKPTSAGQTAEQLLTKSRTLDLAWMNKCLGKIIQSFAT